MNMSICYNWITDIFALITYNYYCYKHGYVASLLYVSLQLVLLRLYIFVLCNLLCQSKDICRTPGRDRKCPMNLCLSVIPSFRLSGSFLEISSLMFYETLYVSRGPCGAVLKSQFVLEKLLLRKDDQELSKMIEKWRMGLFCRILFLNLADIVAKKSTNDVVSLCKNYVSGNVLFDKLQASKYRSDCRIL